MLVVSTKSGNGKTSWPWSKGQKARSGGGVRLGFEGGQTPLLRRLQNVDFLQTSTLRICYCEP